MEYIIDAPGGPYTVVQSQYLNVSPAELHTYSLGTYEYFGGETAKVSLPLTNVVPRPSGQTLVMADTMRFLRRSACTHTPVLAGTPCGDGQFCNGDETCSQGACVAGVNPCEAGFVCEEATQSCAPDCNANGVADADDIVFGTSEDCNANGLPDECDVANPFVIAESGPLSPVDSAVTLSFVVPQAPPALDNVTMGFAAVADLSATTEFIDVRINGSSVGQVFASVQSDCPASPNIDQLIVPKDEFNGLLTGGDALIELAPSPAVEAFGCSTFVDATILYEAYADFNGNEVPDACELPDYEGDGDVDLRDFAAFQVCIDQSTASCTTAFDRAAPEDGTVHGDDLPFFVAYLTGPSSAGEMLIMGEGEEMLETPLSSSEAPAEPLTASLALEVQPIGGGDGLTVLEPDTAYELHYIADNNAIHDFIVFAVSTNALSSIVTAQAAGGGEWAKAGNFQFTDLRAESPPAPAPGADEGDYWYGLAMDGFWTSAGTAGNTGWLFNFTTGSAGKLALQAYMVGDSDGAIVTMHDTLKLVVVAGE